MTTMKLTTLLTTSTLLFLLTSSRVTAQEDPPPMPLPPQEETLEGKVLEVVEESNQEPEAEEPLSQKLQVLITKGSLKGTEVTIETGMVALASQQTYREGDEVVINYSKSSTGEELFFITDYVRRGALLWLFVIFVILTTVVGRWRGLTSLLGMGLSFAVIFTFILPRIATGSDPVVTTVIGSLIIIPITFYLSHGFNQKTTIAIAGTVIALIITGFLASFFVGAAKLTGFATDESGFLKLTTSENLNMKGLLLSGIIIGVLGVLDDITVSQSAIVKQLKAANPKIPFNELYTRAMDVGQDHISSMVNTLVLVYTGASLPLLLLFIDNPQPFLTIINYEMLSDEIIRTLVGSIGLILAVPITTLIAALTMQDVFFKDRRRTTV